MCEKIDYNRDFPKLGTSQPPPPSGTENNFSTVQKRVEFQKNTQLCSNEILKILAEMDERDLAKGVVECLKRIRMSQTQRATLKKSIIIIEVHTTSGKFVVSARAHETIGEVLARIDLIVYHIALSVCDGGGISKPLGLGLGDIVSNCILHQHGSVKCERRGKETHLIQSLHLDASVVSAVTVTFPDGHMQRIEQFRDFNGRVNNIGVFITVGDVRHALATLEGVSSYKYMLYDQRDERDGDHQHDYGLSSDKFISELVPYKITKDSYARMETHVIDDDGSTLHLYCQIEPDDIESDDNDSDDNRSE